MACRPYNTGRCLLLRLFNPSKLWGSLHLCPYCDVDSVIGDASGIELNPIVLDELNKMDF